MVELRKLTQHEDFATLVELQRQIWGFSDVEVLPIRFFVVASHVGGQVFGAFDEQRMIGFLTGLPGLKHAGEGKEPEGYLHSHMLGVLPDYANRGLGRMLKLLQREDCLMRGIRLVEWTFDPLEIKNAYFNIERLGAVMRRYVPNQYGTTQSFLHTGLPTDRLVAEWRLDSPRVEDILNGKATARGSLAGRVQIPAAIGQMRREDPKSAREVQRCVEEQFQGYFAQGLAVIGYEKSDAGGAFLIGALPEDAQ